ncbi:hypothetical protein QOZ80_6BG0483350 [Eleusine coracana subsp. coracana]|nr:hypothetical protein QOZ80_6BG0483350 [Eleusine coracana subsp. coracana]
MAKPAGVKACICVIFLLAVAWVLVLAFAFVHPVQVTVDEATLGVIALAAPATNSTGNGTAAAASPSYGVALVVSVYNPNWAMTVWRTAPLDAELRFAGRAFYHIEMASWHRISPQREWIHRFIAADDDNDVLGRHGGVLKIEVVVTGQFKYAGHHHRRSLRVTCPLELALPAPFTRVVCT